MTSLEEAFTKLLGKQPTDAEKQGLYRTRDALGLKNNDALWLLLMALGHYETLYGRFPALIANAATEATARARQTADAECKAAAARARSELAKTVARSAREIADRSASARRWQWLTIGIVTSALTFCGVTAWVHRVGRRSGYDAGRLEGYSDSRSEIAAASWANTPEGQLAFGLAKAGSVRNLATCSGSGWQREGDHCFVKPANGVIHGWAVSAQPQTGPETFEAK